MEKEKWINEIHRIYAKRKVDLSSYSSRAPHRRIEGQFGSSRAVKGYEHVIVYLQLSPRIDFGKVRHFLRYRLLQWVKKNWDYPEKLDVFFFNNEEGKLIHNTKCWTRLSAPIVSLVDFIDNTVKSKNPGNVRRLHELYPKTTFSNLYRDGQHPNSRDLLIFISDYEGFDVDEKLKESLNRKLRRIIWVKMEKENEVFVKTRKIPFLENNFEEIKNEINEEDINNIDNANTSSKKYLDKSDFYLFFRIEDLSHINLEKPMEISGNILTIVDDLRNPFSRIRNMGETFFIPTDRIIDLKNKLIKLGIYQIEKEYSSISFDGNRWELIVRINGREIPSKGHNNYPPNWSQIVKAIEDCVKYKNRLNTNRMKLVNKNKQKGVSIKKLKKNNNLFNYLEKYPPEWWKNLKNDKEIIIEIRSDKSKSYIDCYYNGGCILGRLDCDRKGNLKGTLHYKYIPIKLNSNGDYVNYNFNNQQIDLNHIKPNIPKLNNFDENAISLIKKQIENYYPKYSEKWFQYQFIQKDSCFIDSEFQFNKFRGNNLRIDLVRIDPSVKKIIFIELKEFGNKELFNNKNTRNNKGKNIENQLSLYGNFISKNKDDILEYYKDLFEVKKKLELLSPETLKIDLDDYMVAEKPLLIIAGCTQKWIDNNAEDINNRIESFALGCLYFGEPNKNSNITVKGKNRRIF